MSMREILEMESGIRSDVMGMYGYYGYCGVCGHWRQLKRLVCHGKEVIYNAERREFTEVGDSYGMADGPGVSAVDGDIGVKYFRTNPPGWHVVDSDGQRVRKVSKAEAMEIRDG